MSTLSKRDLYPHLSEARIEASEKFSSTYSVENTITESDRLLSQKLNDEADLLCPISAYGHRISDIDAINEIQDIRLQNIMIARLQPLGQDMPNTLTDDQLIDSVIRRNLTSVEVGDMANEFNYLKEESQRLYDEYLASQEKQNAYVPETKE